MESRGKDRNMMLIRKTEWNDNVRNNINSWSLRR